MTKPPRPARVTRRAMQWAVPSSPSVGPAPLTSPAEVDPPLSADPRQQAAVGRVHDIKWTGTASRPTSPAASRRSEPATVMIGPNASPAIACAAARLQVRLAVIDGKAVILDECGRSSFCKLQADLDRHGSDRAVLYAFDLLVLDASRYARSR